MPLWNGTRIRVGRLNTAGPTSDGFNALRGSELVHRLGDLARLYGSKLHLANIVRPNNKCCGRQLSAPDHFGKTFRGTSDLNINSLRRSSLLSMARREREER